MNATSPADGSDPNPSKPGHVVPGTTGSKPSGPWIPPTPEELATLLDGYQIVTMLGRGGMGAVYLGTQTSLDRPVAIKILSGVLENSDLGFKERFKNEARAMAKLSHPGIVAVHDSGETSDGLLYIVMEYVDGTDVSRMIAAEGRLHTEHAMAIAAHVCDALAYAHERGIIHRDIKPANIMVSYEGEVKVADFGLAKVHSDGTTLGLTMSGIAMGTMHYIAPEALQSSDPVDHRADIYAVGVMLYQMLTGKLPQGIFELPSSLVSGLDPRYDGIIAKAMREDRDERYPTIRDLRADLDAILTQPVPRIEENHTQAVAALPTMARPKRPGGKAARRAPQPAARAPMPKSSKGWLVWPALALVALGGGYVWLNRDERIEQHASSSLPSQVRVRSMSSEKTSPSDHVTEKPSSSPPAIPSTPPGIPPAPPVAEIKAETTGEAAPNPGERVRWEIPFSKETYESRADPALLGKTVMGQVPDEAYLIQSDRNHGVLRWQFADSRLSQPGLEVSGAHLRFHTMNRPVANSDSEIFATLDERIIGRQTGTVPGTWNELKLDPAQIPRTPSSFDLVLHCGINGTLVSNQKSKLTASLVLEVETPLSSPVPTAATVIDRKLPPELLTRIANFQKARQNQLGDLTGKFRVALETAKTGAPGEAASYDLALAATDARAVEIAELNSKGEVAALAAMPAPPESAPDRLKELLRIFNGETAKIEALLVAGLGQSLAAVEAELVRAERIADAEIVNACREDLATFASSPVPPPSPAGAANGDPAKATKETPFVNSLGMKFVPVPGTKVLFCIHETRKRDYAEFAEETPGLDQEWKDTDWKGLPLSPNPEDPVVRLTWRDAKRFCDWLGKSEGWTYRLPTDREWSFAVGIGEAETEKADSTPSEKNGAIPGVYPWGDTTPGRGSAPVGNFSDESLRKLVPRTHGIHGYDDGFPTTAPVMNFPPNALGIHDLGGNVWEMCEDWFVPAQKRRLQRGGSWNNHKDGALLSSGRLWCPGVWAPGAHGKGDATGFRIVVELP